MGSLPDERLKEIIAEHDARVTRVGYVHALAELGKALVRAEATTERQREAVEDEMADAIKQSRTATGEGFTYEQGRMRVCEILRAALSVGEGEQETL